MRFIIPATICCLLSSYQCCPEEDLENANKIFLKNMHRKFNKDPKIKNILTKNCPIRGFQIAHMDSINFADLTFAENGQVVSQVDSADGVQLRHTSASCENKVINCDSIFLKKYRDPNAGNRMRITSTYNCKGISNYQDLSLEEYVNQLISKIGYANASNCNPSKWELEFKGTVTNGEHKSSFAKRNNLHVHNPSCSEFIECDDVQISSGSGFCVIKDGHDHGHH